MGEARAFTINASNFYAVFGVNFRDSFKLLPFLLELLERVLSIEYAGVPVIVGDRYRWRKERRGYMSRIKSSFSLASRVLKACHKYRTVFIFSSLVFPPRARFCSFRYIVASAIIVECIVRMRTKLLTMMLQSNAH